MEEEVTKSIIHDKEKKPSYYMLTERVHSCKIRVELIRGHGPP